MCDILCITEERKGKKMFDGRNEETRQKIEVLKKLYPLASENTFNTIIPLLWFFGGTMLSDLILDTYDYMIYDEYPTTTKYIEGDYIEQSVQG
jgi:hypothetical protein